MKQLYRYLAVMFAQRFAITAFGLVTLLGTLDALGNADLLPDGSGLGAQLWYMLLKMPILFDRILVFTVLMALLLTYFSLIRRNELVAIVAAGLSIFGQVLAFIPAVVIATVLSGILINQINPHTTRALVEWLGPEAVYDDGQAPQTLWLADGKLLVQVGSLNSGTLSDITLFERSEKGRIAAVSWARNATEVKGGWALSDVSQTRYDGQDLDPPTIWQTKQTPHTLRLLMSQPRDLALLDLYRLSHMKGSGSLPLDAYFLWFLNRLSLPLVAIGFVLMTVPIMQHLGRRASGELSLVTGVGVGFSFMVIDGVFKSLSESGSISAVSAICLPLSMLWLIGLYLSWRKSASA